MRILKINNELAEIDDQTVIGIDYQAYDVKQPGKRFVSVSNTFSIPKTARNMSLIGNAGNPQSISTTVYNVNYCSYWVDNQIFIDNAKLRVDSVSDRIYIFIFEKKDIWDQLKEDKWGDVTQDFLAWLVAEKNYPASTGTNFTGTFEDFIASYTGNTEGLTLPFYRGNLGNPIPWSGGEFNAEVSNNITLEYYYNSNPDYIWGHGGHWCAFVKTIFEYIEFTYGVNFLTAGGEVTGNIWDDPVALAMYIPMNEISIIGVGDYADCEIGFYYIGTDAKFLPYKNVRDKPDKSLYDFVQAFFQHLNIIVDDIEVDGLPVIALRRLDDLPTLGEIKNMTGKLTGTPIFKPGFESIARSNYIKFKSVHKDLTPLSNSRNITSLNENLDFDSTLFEIDSYIPGVESFLTDWLTQTFDYILSLTEQEAFKTFVFMVNGDLTDYDVSVTYIGIGIEGYHTMSALQPLYKAALYDLGSEYLTLESALQYPIFYEVDAWLKPSDIRNLEFFKMYYFKELNGSYFLNKISGFNPDKSLEPTRLELLRISDKTPVLESTLDFWVDGEQDEFTDGEDNYFF